MELVLTTKAQKLMRLCESAGYDNAYELLQAVAGDSVCPAICMTEGCDYTGTGWKPASTIAGSSAKA